MKIVSEIIDELVAIGNAYPKEKGGFLGMFQHTNQAAATQLIALGSDKTLVDYDLLAKKITGICDKNFSRNGSLLRQIINCLYNSKAFETLTTYIDATQENIEFANAHNDGGASRRWTFENYMAAIRSLKPVQAERLSRNSVIEMKSKFY